MPPPEKLKSKLVTPKKLKRKLLTPSDADGDVWTGVTLYALSTIIRMAGAKDIEPVDNGNGLFLTCKKKKERKKKKRVD